MSHPQTEISTRASQDEARVTEELMLVVLTGKARGTRIKLREAQRDFDLRFL